MRYLSVRLPILGLALAMAGSIAPAMAATHWEFLFSASHASDDDQHFLNLTVKNYAYDRHVLEPLLPRLRYVEIDLPVVLFLAHTSGRSVETIVTLRAKGLSWSIIFGKVRVPVDVLFVGIHRNPGPPHGKAWGHWKKRGRAVPLTDHDIRGFVWLQVGNTLTGISAFELAQAHGKGRSVSTVVVEKKGRPHHAKPPKAGGSNKGKGRGKGD